QSPVDFNVDISSSDDHEWGQQRLNSLLKESTAEVSAADENLLLDLEAAARSWQLRLPEWTKRAHGYYHLNTPYGHLVVRRLIGWTVERNGVPLTWFCVCSGNTVIFDKLEHAKTSALLHARDRGLAFSFRDGTRWREPAHTHHSGRAPFGSAG